MHKFILMTSLRPKFLFSSVFLLLLIVSCGNRDSSTLNQPVKLQLSQAGNVTPVISLPQIHYKYADSRSFDGKKISDGVYIFEVLLDSSTVATLHIQEKSVPVFLKRSSDTLFFTASRFDFPQNVTAQHYTSDWSKKLDEWLSYETDTSDSLQTLRELWLENGDEQYTDFLKKQHDFADHTLSSTPFESESFAKLGEWLVRRIESLDRADVALTKRSPLRQKILSDAKDFDFFTFEKLWWQRAGSRDFTYYWAHSFGVGDSLETVYDQDLNQYDINRLGFDRFTELKMDVIEDIEDPKAQAYSEMYLTAEIIGEAPFSEATHHFQSFQDAYKNQYPAFSELLSSFYERMKRVQPGQPAFEFTYPDRNGDLVSLSDFEGKLVFLDLWASWCSPCFEEFPYMRNLRKEFSEEEFVMIGIGLDEEKATWEYTLSQNDLPWIQLYGGGELENELFQKYQAGGVPFVVLIDEKGDILRYNDVRPSFNLEEVVRDHLEN